MRLPDDQNIIKKNLFGVLYITAVFAAVYSCKYIIDALAYMLSDLGSTLESLSLAAGKLLGIFSVVVIGFIIAYILDPIVIFLEKKLSIKRFYSVILIYLALILFLGAAVFALIKNIAVYDKSDMSNALYLAYLHYKGEFSKLYGKISAAVHRYDYFGIIPELKCFASGLDLDCIQTAKCVGKWAANGVLSLIVAFYFLKDKRRILHGLRRFFRAFIPDRVRICILAVLTELDTVFSGYIRGQLTDASIMAVLISAVLSMLKIPFSIPIGIITGFSNIIPYFGAFVGLVLAFVTALISRGAGRAFAAAAAVIALQQVDNIVIAPKVVGDKVSLSPLIVIIALGTAGNLFGIWGMVFAVPAAALIKTFCMKLIKQKEAKK